jgi:hypothetical protein
MQKTVNLHSATNSSEASDATVTFKDRALSLKIDNMAYGNHFSSFSIWFHNPQDMLDLAKALTLVAIEAQECLKNNP